MRQTSNLPLRCGRGRTGSTYAALRPLERRLIIAGGVAAGTFPSEQGYVVSFVLLLALAAIISLAVPRETKQ